MLRPSVVLITMVLYVLLCTGCTTAADRNGRGEATVTSTLAGKLRQLPPVPPPPWTTLQADWTFALGTPREGLDAPLSSLPGRRQPVKLPHRLLEPDTPFWYAAEAEVPGDAVFSIAADDGAHLFVDGVRIPMERGAFAVPGAPRRAHIVVRAVNKAMTGGLDRIQWAPRADFDRYLRESDLRSRLDALVRKIGLMPAATAEQEAAVRDAVQRGASRETVEAAERALSSSPVVIVGPYLQAASSRAVSIVWETDLACAASVTWGEGSAPTRTADAGSDGTLHVARLSSLSPGAEYAYTIGSGSALSPRYTFRTLPEGDAVDFAAWADAQTRWDVLSAHVRNMQKLPLAFTVSVGDAVERGYMKEPWMGLFETLRPISSRVPTFLVGGNHEYDGCFEDLRCPYLERYGRTLPTPHHFAWTAGNARFLALDPNPYFPTDVPEDSEQRSWFLRELRSGAWKQATWRFLFIHQPPYSQGWTDYHGDLPIRAMLDPLIEEHGIDFVVSGHTHDYERLTKTYGEQKVHYIIAGGAGGGLEKGSLSAEPVMDKVIRLHHFVHFHVEGDRVVVDVIGADGKMLDSLEAVK